MSTWGTDFLRYHPKKFIISYGFKYMKPPASLDKRRLTLIIVTNYYYQHLCSSAFICG